MMTTQKAGESRVKLAAPELPAAMRSGGERLPLEYPHLYQIQAGDWRISYSVEHNRLAILVLEVLNPDGSSSKDPARENLAKKVKVKLLDWPEDSGHGQLPPEEIARKLKIKWLDMAEEAEEARPAGSRLASRIKLKGTGSPAPSAPAPASKSRITLLDSGETVVEDQADPEATTDDGKDGRRITPLDEPST